MATVVNRSTKQVLYSVNTPDYSPAEWIIDPDLSAVEGWPVRYWVVSGDAVSLMDQAARDALDAAIQSAALDALADQIGSTDVLLKAFAGVLVDEINILRAEHALAPRSLSQLRDAIRSKM